MSRIEGGRVSARQLAAMLVLTRVAVFTVTFPTMTGIRTPQVAWIASLLAMLASIPFTLAIVQLGLRFPDKTIIEYSETLLGRYLGKLVGLVLVWYWVHICADVAREIGEAHVVTTMRETPMLVFMIVTVFLAANAARSGLEVVGRVSENIVWVVLFFLAIILILPYDELRFRNLLPLLPRDPRAILVPMGEMVSFYAELIVVGMVLPYLDRPADAARHSTYAVLASGLLMAWLAADLVAAFGPTISAQALPAFGLSRLISIGNFLERIEAAAMAAWTLTGAAKLALFLWASAVGLAQLFGVGRFQPFVYPLGAIVVAFGILFFESLAALQAFFAFPHFGVYSLTIALGTMALLYVAAFLRGSLRPREGG